MTRVALLALLAAAVSGCIHSTSRDVSTPHPPSVNAGLVPRASVVLRFQSIRRSVPPVHLAVRCGPTSGAFSKAVCGSIDRQPRVYASTYRNQGCIGGAALVDLRVDGEINGRSVHLKQAGMCGPKGIYAWWALLRRHAAQLPPAVRTYALG
jgi:hypothetical protein